MPSRSLSSAGSNRASRSAIESAALKSSAAASHFAWRALRAPRTQRILIRSIGTASFAEYETARLWAYAPTASVRIATNNILLTVDFMLLLPYWFSFLSPPSSCSYRTAMVTPAWLDVFPTCTTTGTTLPLWMPPGILAPICTTPAMFLVEVKTALWNFLFEALRFHHA